MTYDPESGRHYFPTGRHRLRPAGNMVVLQVEETTRYPAMPTERWRDACPQDVLSMIAIDLSPGRITVGIAPKKGGA